jgi:pimeloyl-ACP methyl ester carboxylesterase
MATRGRIISVEPGTVRPPRYHLYAPDVCAAMPPLVFVPGSSGDPAAQFRALLPLARARQSALLVPDFRGRRFRGYQRLAAAGSGMASAWALRHTLADAALIGDMAFHRFDLAGFSGGAQFAHRYALFFPSDVCRLVVVAAGWYTWLDPDMPFPDGTSSAESSAGRPADLGGFLNIPMRVMVGEHDVVRDARLRTATRLDRLQGTNRVERAVRWAAHVTAAASGRGLGREVLVEYLPGTTHSFRTAMGRGGLGARMIKFLSEGAASGAPHASAGKGGRRCSSIA